MQDYAIIVGQYIINTIRWDGTTPWTPPDGSTIMLLEVALDAGYTYAIRPPSVPDAVQPVQLRTWLLYAGKLDTVDQLIALEPDPIKRREAQQRWDYTLTIPRNHPLVKLIGDALGMTDSDMDAAFIQASTL